MITLQTEEKALAQAIGVSALYLKREDLHPYGSHKGRSIPVMIDMKAASGAKSFAISSSGNAALAAIRYVQKKNFEGSDYSLSVFIGEHINTEKKARLLSEIKDPRVTITESKRPLQALFEMIKGEHKESLRQSIDPHALVGYLSLAEELALIPHLATVFIASSSGTCAEALAEYFNEKSLNISVNIVQTTSCFPLVSELNPNTTPASLELSTADAIVDKVAYRKGSLSAALTKGRGAGWIASNADIVQAQTLLREKANIDTSPNGALGLAGLLKALEKGPLISGSIACIITGR